jgi:RNA polymerase sigma-70 factor, ECF subfamily
VSPERREKPQGESQLGALIRRLASGDPAAAAELYDATSHLVFGLALRIVGERSAAEDIVVEVYTQAWNLAPSFDAERGSGLGWLLMLTRSRALDARRARKRDLASETLEVIENRASECPGPEETSSLAERQRAVMRAMGGLSADQREAIQLAYFGGLSHSQIAARLEEPLGTVKTRIRQGMIQLRDLLGHLAPAAASKGMR